MGGTSFNREVIRGSTSSASSTSAKVHQIASGSSTSGKTVQFQTKGLNGSMKSNKSVTSTNGLDASATEPVVSQSTMYVSCV